MLCYDMLYHSMLYDVRAIERPAIQVVKHFIPNTIENHRTDMTEVVESNIFNIHVYTSY